jgi:hypothetical protein
VAGPGEGQRSQFGASATLLKEIVVKDPKSYFNNSRLKLAFNSFIPSPSMFILRKIVSGATTVF